jgi:hypothetical protein
MHTQARRFALLAAALLLLSVVLVACATPAAPAAPAGNNTGGVNIFHTPNPNAASPTPTFPPFTIGAFPSNYSPSNNEHMTIYVLCRIQPQDLSGPPTPASGITVQVFVGAPINQSFTKATGNDGLAAIEFDENDPQSGLPVPVDVTVVYKGVTYHAETFFTPNPTAAPTATPGETPTGTPTGAPSGTPTGTP